MQHGMCAYATCFGLTYDPSFRSIGNGMEVIDFVAIDEASSLLITSSDSACEVPCVRSSNSSLIPSSDMCVSVQLQAQQAHPCGSIKEPVIDPLGTG
jgi:hypothetical protein